MHSSVMSKNTNVDVFLFGINQNNMHVMLIIKYDSYYC